MKKSAKILSLSLAATFLLGITACSEKNPTPTTPSPTATSSAPSPSASSSPSSTPTRSDSPIIAGTELKAAKEAFPDVKDEEGAKAEDIQLALYGSQRYINTVYNNGYLANGSWVANGADSQELVTLVGKDWSDSYRAKLESIINQYHHGPDEAAKTSAARDLMLHFFYFDNSEGMTVPDDCKENNVGVASCLVGATIDIKSGPSYQVNKSTGSIYVTTSFTANMRFVKDGIVGVSPVQYEMQLEMIKNPYPDEENLRFAYVVNDLGGSWKIDAWHEGE